MAHELHISAAGKASMAFVGETPWHHLGQQVTEGASLETWTREAGFEWNAIGTPAMFRDASGVMHEMPEMQVIYRDDDRTPLSVMGKGYKIVQPAQVLGFFRDMAESGGWHIHTAGVLRGGRKLWAMAKNNTHGEVVPGDKVKGNLLFVTSLDGTTPTIVCMTCIRVVCANTVREALRDRNRGRTVRVSHRSIFDETAVKAEMGFAHETFDSFMAKARAMAEMPCHLEEARSILRELFGKPLVSKTHGTFAAPASIGETLAINAFASVGADNAGSALLSSLLANKTDGTTQVREQKSVARCLSLFGGEGMGANHEGVAGTRWGLFNAVTQHIDHEQGRTADTRLDSAWFGRGDGFKQTALELLLAK